SSYRQADCRYPDYMDVLRLAFLGFWIPAIRAGMTVLLVGRDILLIGFGYANKHYCGRQTAAILQNHEA
ncbi:MAG: hypothetical protein ACREXT_16845, partial [Gammaproteobacteria bacterium]